MAFQEDLAFTVRAQTGSWFCGFTSDFHGYPFSVHGFYEWRNWAIGLALCTEGDTIIEIGANVGTETVGFRDIVGARGKVIAFEPLPANFQAIKQLIALNHWDNVVLINSALGDRNGQVTFVPPPSKQISGVGYIIADQKPLTAQVIDVECTRLDALGGEIGAAQMVFCDTEGAETMVWRGAQEYLRQYQPAMVLEASPKLLRRAGSSIQELHQEIRNAGYRAFAIERFGVIQVTDLNIDGAGNWLCLPDSKVGLADPCTRMIRKCAFMPCIRGMNPLCSIRQPRKDAKFVKNIIMNML